MHLAAAISTASCLRRSDIKTSLWVLTFIATGTLAPPQVLAADSTLMGGFIADSSYPSVLMKVLLIVSLILVVFTAGVRHAPFGIKATALMKAGDESHLGVTLTRFLGPAHALDIFILASCSQRFVISVGFDRQIRLWNLTTAEPTYGLVFPTAGRNVSWPISAVALDDHGEWLSLCSQDGSIVLWNCHHHRLGRHIPGQTETKVSACFFMTAHWRSRTRSERGSALTARLLVILESGTLLDVDVEGTDVTTSRICVGKVQRPYLSWTSQLMTPKLLTVTTKEAVFISANRDGAWTTQQLRFPSIEGMTTIPSRALRCIVVPTLRGVAFMHDENNSALHLVDLFSDALIHTFHPRPFHHSSLRAFHPQPQQCIYCGSTAVSSFSVAYIEKGECGGFSMTTVAAPRAKNSQSPARPICLRSERDARERRCAGFTFGVESSFSLKNPGAWEATGANGVAGVRRKKSPVHSRDERSSSTLTYRGRDRVQARQTSADDTWEAWSMTALGVTAFHDLATKGLPAQQPGPACRLARNGVAVALANSLVVVQFGSLLRDDDGAGGLPSELLRGRLSRRNTRIARTSSSKGSPG